MAKAGVTPSSSSSDSHKSAAAAATSEALKKRTVMYVGVNFDVDFASDYRNINIVGDGSKFVTTSAALAVKHCDHVILCAHGEDHYRNSPQETHTQENLFSVGSPSTISNIAVAVRANSPEHITLISCNSGAVGNDIEEALDNIAQEMLSKKPPLTHMTISAISSAKYSSIEHLGAVYCNNIENSDNKQPRWLQEIEMARDAIPETIKQYHVVIDEGKPKLLAVKIRSPKDVNEIRNPDKFIGTSSIKPRGGKSPKDIQLIVENGDPNDPALRTIYDTIIAMLSAGDKKFSKEYIQNGLLIATARNKPELVREYIAQGADPNHIYTGGATASYLAASLGNSKAMEVLIAAGANVNATTDGGSTPLAVAAEEGYEAIVEMLVGRVDVNIPSSGGTPLLKAAFNHADVVRTLLANGALVNTARDDGITPLHAAAEKGRFDIAQILLEQGADLDAQSIDGRPLDLALRAGKTRMAQFLNDAQDALFQEGIPGLHKFIDRYNKADEFLIAAEEGNAQKINELVAKGYDINATGQNNATAIYLAAQNGHAEVVDLLLKAKAKPDIGITSLKGQTALHIAAKKGYLDVVQAFIANAVDLNMRQDDGMTPLHFAATNNRADIVEAMLATKKVEIDAVTRGNYTPLLLASQDCHLDCMRLLLDHKANPNIPRDDGRTPLHMTCIEGNIAAANLLLAHGAIIDATDQQGVTALHAAVDNWHMPMVEFLVSKGASVLAETLGGLTPRAVAEMAEEPEIAAFLATAEVIESARNTGEALQQQGLVASASAAAGSRPPNTPSQRGLGGSFS